MAKKPKSTKKPTRSGKIFTISRQVMNSKTGLGVAKLRGSLKGAEALEGEPPGGVPIPTPVSMTVVAAAAELGLRLSDALKRRLSRERIHTLADLAAMGGLDKVRGVSLKSTHPHVTKLNAFLRLAPLGITPKAIPALMDLNIDSPRKLAMLRRKDVLKVAKALGISKLDVGPLALKAQGLANDSRMAVANTLLYSRRSPPQWLTGEGDEACGCTCAEENSTVSRFAYLVDLLERRPGTSVVIGRRVRMRIDYRVWYDELKLDMKGLAPSSGREQIPQIVLCNEVLARAFPDPLTKDERFLIRRCLIQALLGFAQMTIRTVAEAVTRLLPSSARNVSDLVQRLQETLRADLLSP